LHTAAGDLGNASAAGLAVVAVALATWQAAFLPLIVGFGALLLALELWSRESYVFDQFDLDVRATGHRLFGSSRVRWFLIVYVLFAFTWQSTTAFLPTFLQIEKGFSLELASTGFAVLFVVGMVVKPVAGLVGDRFRHAAVAAGALLLGLGGLVGILLADRTAVLFVGIGVFAAGLMAFPPVVGAFLIDTFPEESMGGDLGGCGPSTSDSGASAQRMWGSWPGSRVTPLHSSGWPGVFC
jgi:MFS family permease